MDTLSNVSLQKVIQLMAIYIHEQAVDIRKHYVIDDGMLKIYSDYVVYPTDDYHYYAFHYCVHVDKETERFFIVTWTPSTEDEYLDSLKF